jgi:polysaccharide biosynthesis protein PslH
MTPQSAFFLTPEDPKPGTGGGGLRSASLLEYLRTKYDVQVASFTVPHHSKSFTARAWRNGVRLVRGVPPLFDRFAGFEGQLDLKQYRVAVIEHFWCAQYADVIRPHCDLLVLDLHNVESELAATHARAAGGIEGIVHRRFAEAYRRLEREWIPKFDLILTTSEDDRARIEHKNVIVYPNALPWTEVPHVKEENCIVFSGNLEYHPNIEAVRWFTTVIWPKLRDHGMTWKIIGRNPEAIASIIKKDPQIHVTGPVDDAIKEIATARVVVVPLLSGSGTRFKILEAWAAARPVVSTNIGAEGLGAIDGKHLRIANDAASFAAAVFDHPTTLGTEGRALYEKRYTWPSAWKTITPLF